MKKFFLALIIGFFVCFIINSKITATQTALADGVIRLHVIANSDSEADQALKLKVRDRVLAELGLTAEGDMDTVSYEICTKLDLIKLYAEDEIIKNGYNYNVRVSYGLSEFPEKRYSDIVLPSGMYQALKIEIGEAEGKNWWCVMFPPLCFVSDDCIEMADASHTALKNGVGEDVYAMINTNSSGYNVKLKLYELWQQGQKMIAGKN